MDTTLFDRLAMTVAEAPSRRDLLRLLGAAAFGAGALALLDADEAEAKRRRKKRKKKKKKKKNRASCGDGRKNGAETDVDCGGGCPRCRAGKACGTRDDCTTALCVDGICTSPANADECGLDTNGETCFTREFANTEGKFCSRQLCNLVPGGTCDACTGDEQCAPAGGNDIECCKPCGSPL